MIFLKRRYPLLSIFQIVLILFLIWDDWNYRNNWGNVNDDWKLFFYFASSVALGVHFYRIVKYFVLRVKTKKLK